MAKPATVAYVARQPMTDAQREVLRLIYFGVLDSGYQPSFTDIAWKCGVRHRSAIMFRVKGLVRGGWVVAGGNKSRRAVKLLRRPDGRDFTGFADRTPLGATLPKLNYHGVNRCGDLLRFLYTFTRDQGYQPSVRQMGAFLGVTSPNAVQRRLYALAARGYLSLREGSGEARAHKMLLRSDGSPFEGYAPKD